MFDLNESAKPEEHSEPEVQEPPISTKCRAENGIDLNKSPLSSEGEVSTKSGVASSHGKQGSEPSRSIVLALPCSKTISLYHKRYSRPRKKAERGARSTNMETSSRSKSRKRSNLDSNFGVHEDENHSLNPASYIPDSDHYQERLEKWGSKGKRSKRCKPHIESGKIMRKISRSKSMTRGSSLVAEEEEQELSVAAPEAKVDMPLSDSA